MLLLSSSKGSPTSAVLTGAGVLCIAATTNQAECPRRGGGEAGLPVQEKTHTHNKDKVNSKNMEGKTNRKKRKHTKNTRDIMILTLNET